MREALFAAATFENVIPSEHLLRQPRALINEAMVRLHGLLDAICAEAARARAGTVT